MCVALSTCREKCHRATAIARRVRFAPKGDQAISCEMVGWDAGSIAVMAMFSVPARVATCHFSYSGGESIVEPSQREP
jgi:hypothetical protein